MTAPNPMARRAHERKHSRLIFCGKGTKLARGTFHLSHVCSPFWDDRASANVNAYVNDHETE